jgi:hypothetical protein
MCNPEFPEPSARSAFFIIVEPRELKEPRREEPVESKRE